MLKLPAVESLVDASIRDRTHVLDLLFEPSHTLHDLVLPMLADVRFASYDDLIAAVDFQLTVLAKSLDPSETARLDQIMCAHPRLGEGNVESAQSTAEQASLNKAGPDADAEAAELKRLNEAYERVYPRLKYVVFVNGRSRREVVEDMRQRIANGSITRERDVAINAICQIAGDRARKLRSE